MNGNESAGTRVVAAVVVRVDLESWADVKRLLVAAGCEIIYQRAAPLGVHLRIVERNPRESGP